MPAKPPKPGRPPKPPANPGTSALGAAATPAASAAPAAAATAAWLAATVAGVKARFEVLPIRGPSVEPINVELHDMAVHAGTAAYMATTLVNTPPSENPDTSVTPPKGFTTGVAAAEAGDARFCSAMEAVEASCDRADCTPAPADVPAVSAVAVPCAANAARLVVCGAALNGITGAVAAAELAA